MAGAKETPRQKLISLMYLVFITMLALNVSKEVLDGFGQMFVKISDANNRVADGNNNLYENIAVNDYNRYYDDSITIRITIITITRTSKTIRWKI